MKDRNSTEQKTRNLIAFRPDEGLKADFYKSVEMLDVSDSLLARRAVKAGLKIAVEEIAQERKAQAEELLKKLSERKQSTYACGHYPHVTRRGKAENVVNAAAGDVLQLPVVAVRSSESVWESQKRAKLRRCAKNAA